MATSDGLTAEDLLALGEVLGQGGPAAPARRGRVRLYDFRVPDKFSKDQMRALEHLHEPMARSLTTALSANLRSTVQIEAPTVEQLTYQQYVAGLPEPTIVAIVGLAPLEGTALLQIDNALAFPMIERLLGGRGAASIERALTEVEAVIMRRVLLLALDVWCDTWKHVVAVHGSLSAIESNPLFVQVAAPNDIVLVVSFAARLGHQASRMMRFCLPFSLLEPVLEPLTSRQWFQRLPQKERPEDRRVMVDALAAVALPVTASLGGARLSLQDLINLKPGDLVSLGVRTSQPVEILVNGQPKFVARPGRVGAHMGVQIIGPSNT